MRYGCYFACVMLLFSVTCDGLSAEVELPDEGADRSILILDTMGSWRIHSQLSPPMISHADGVRAMEVKKGWLRSSTKKVDDNWAAVDFDDSGWLRGPARKAAWSPFLAEACLRGKFEVKDLSSASGLRINIAYKGGVVVYLNGSEIARNHMSGNDDKLADDYPREAFMAESGKMLGKRSVKTSEDRRREGMQTRKLGEVVLPKELLREGVNVVGVKIVRSAYDGIVDEKKEGNIHSRGSLHEIAWNTCEIISVQLSGVDNGAVASNAKRQVGMKVWNSGPLTSDFDMDFGSNCEEISAIKLVSASNGVASGKVVVGSGEAIVDLKGISSDLRSSNGGLIDGSRVTVRYAAAWGPESVEFPYAGQPGVYGGSQKMLGALYEQAPARIEVVKKKTRKSARIVDPVAGAVVAVWVTVDVPDSTVAGEYRGELRIIAQGEQEIVVPIELRVAGWQLPKTQDFRTWVELFQSPDTLAMEYGLELWSDEHFKLIEKSMQFMNRVGSRTVYVPLICQTNLGNEQSMVRWIKNDDDGGYGYDYSIMERYLDIAQEHMGGVNMVVFNVWDIYVGAASKYDESKKDGQTQALKYLLENKNVSLGDRPIVTGYDPASGEAVDLELPGYGELQSKELWGPMFTELRKRMESRGLGDKMTLGIMSDASPTKEEVAFFSEVATGIGWVSHSHQGVHGRGEKKVYQLAKCAYQTRVWHTQFDDNPADGRMYGWKQSDLIAYYLRSRSFNSFTPALWRHITEFTITGAQRGIGRVGADTWNVVRDKRGNRKGSASARYPQSSWRNLDLYSSLLAAGPAGPVATTRYEMFREGIQECEARIFIELALTDEVLRGDLGEDLAERCERLLDERISNLWKATNTYRLTGTYAHYATSSSTWRGSPGLAGQSWYIGSGWQDRTYELFELAGEVSTKLQLK